MMKPPKILLNLSAKGFEAKYFFFKSFCSVTISLPVSVLRLANNQVLQLGILEPNRVGRFHPVFKRNRSLNELLSPGFERHGLVVDGV